ncbi:MAG: adenosylcobinamide amidohydrolase [Chloroflexi bacterium]|nr:adenosylcobinamide amidohydrolase [Chloroflexota bacterium]
MSIAKEKIYDQDGIRAFCVSHDVFNVPSNMLTVHFDRPRLAVSGLDGAHQNICSVANCHTPKAIWPVLHETSTSWRNYANNCLKACDLEADCSLTLLTGVNMRELAFAEEKEGEVHVRVWATADPNHNAISAGLDSADCYLPSVTRNKVGTINIIIVYNQNLSQASLISAFIIATEAKSNILRTMDITSAYTKGLPATGSGTDQIITVSGPVDGAEPITCYGGHTLLGHLTAKATYKAVKQSLEKSFAVWGKRA